MSRAIFFVAVLSVAGSAWADGTQRVKPSSTVEVLDDKAQIDDVISRLKDEPRTTNGTNELRADRVPPPPVDPAVKKAAEAKSAPLRRPHHERGNGNTERTERPSAKKAK